MKTNKLPEKSAAEILAYTDTEKSISSGTEANGEVHSQNNVIASKGFSDGGLNANIPIIKDALSQWAKQARLKLNLSNLNSLAGLVALKLNNASLQPNSKEALDLKNATDILSNRLLSLGTQLSYEKFADKKLIAPNVKLNATLSNLKKDIVNGIADTDAWQKKLQAELPKIPGWNEAPSETVEKCTKFCLNMVKLLNKCGPWNKKHASSESSGEIEEYQEACDHNRKEMTDDLKKWINRSQEDFPWETLEKPEARSAASKMLGNSLDSMMEEFFIRLISGRDMAGQGSQDNDNTGKYIDVQLTPVSHYENEQGKDDSYMFVISAAQENQGADNGSLPFGGITNPSSGPPIQLIPDLKSRDSKGSASSGQSGFGIGPLAPGTRRRSFRWGMGNYGGIYRSLLQLSGKLVDDFNGYCKGIDSDQFDMKAAAEFQVKTMMFVTTFGSISKALSGALKQAKSVVDAVQA